MICFKFCLYIIPFVFQVEEETVVRVDLENRLQSLKEELAFKEQLYKEVNRYGCCTQNQNPPPPQQCLPHSGRTLTPQPL